MKVKKEKKSSKLVSLPSIKESKDHSASKKRVAKGPKELMKQIIDVPSKPLDGLDEASRRKITIITLW